MDDSISLRINLDGSILEKFKEIKSTNHFKKNTDVIRFCINEASKEEQFNVEEEMIRYIRKLISSKYIQQKFLIFNMNDFMQKALESYITEIKNSVESVASFDVRAHLTEFENKIALAILEIQENTSHGMASESEIANHLGLQGKKKIRETLMHLLEQKFIDRQIINDTIYYRAKY